MRPSLLMPALACAAFLAGAALLLDRSTTEAAEAHDASAAILSTAMLDLGTVQGECFPWVRRVVAAATGRNMGFGYRDGYLSAGAVEVPLSEAQAGDIIQVADDADASASADYPGLHTSIVMQRHGPGTFTVIDSNSLWDGVVRERPDYDPLAAAARYGLEVRAYRFGDGAGAATTDGITPTAFVQSPEPAPTTQTAALTPGSTARVSEEGGCLNLRAAPTIAGNIIRCLTQGSTVTILDGASQADGYTWQLIQAGGDTGWVADEFLVPVSGGAPAPPEPPPSQPPAQTPGTISGSLPTGGGPGLVVWSGGPVESLVTAASDRGCSVLSLWTTVSGAYLGYTNGAPAFVNASWFDRYPGGLETNSPLILVCSGRTGPPAPGPSVPGEPPAPPSSDPRPPGPAGND